MSFAYNLTVANECTFATLCNILARFAALPLQFRHMDQSSLPTGVSQPVISTVCMMYTWHLIQVVCTSCLCAPLNLVCELSPHLFPAPLLTASQ